MNYVIKKSKKKYNIIEFNLNTPGYSFIPKKELKIDEIIIYEPKLIEEVLNIKFNTAFKKIANLIVKISNDEDPNDEDVLMVIGEISRLKGIILNKYNTFLKLTIQKSMLKKIALMEMKLKNKLLSYNFSPQNQETKKSRSR